MSGTRYVGNKYRRNALHRRLTQVEKLARSYLLHDKKYRISDGK